MFQDSFFETIDMPMADQFEAAENRPEPIGVDWPPAPAYTMQQAFDKPLVYCLKCGKATDGAMFCSAKCRSAWIGSMNAFNAKLAKTSLVGESEKPLF